jgi:hypothetical protein
VGIAGVEAPREDVADGEFAGESVACGGSSSSPELGFCTEPVGFEIENATVVDVGVGMGCAPGVWIGGEVAQHVFVDEALEVEAESVATGSDDDVGANAGGSGDVAVGVGEVGVGGVVAGGNAELGAGGGGEAVAGFGRECGGRERGEGRLQEVAAVHGMGLDTAGGVLVPVAMASTVEVSKKIYALCSIMSFRA